MIPTVDEAGFVCRCMQGGRYPMLMKQDFLVGICRKGDIPNVDEAGFVCTFMQEG